MKSSVLRCVWIALLVATVAGGGTILASAGAEYFKNDGPRPIWATSADVGEIPPTQPVQSGISTPRSAPDRIGHERSRPPPRRGGILLLAGLGLWLILISLLWAGRKPLQFLSRRSVEADQPSPDSG